MAALRVTVNSVNNDMHTTTITLTNAQGEHVATVEMKYNYLDDGIEQNWYKEPQMDRPFRTDNIDVAVYAGFSNK